MTANDLQQQKDMSLSWWIKAAAGLLLEMHCGGHHSLSCYRFHARYRTATHPSVPAGFSTDISVILHGNQSWDLRRKSSYALALRKISWPRSFPPKSRWESLQLSRNFPGLKPLYTYSEELFSTAKITVYTRSRAHQ